MERDNSENIALPTYQSSRPNPLSLKLKGTLSSSYTQHDIGPALKLLPYKASEFVSVERGLHDHIVADEISDSVNVLQGFSKLVGKVQQLEIVLSKVERSTKSMRDTVEALKHKMEPALIEESIIGSELLQNNAKKRILCRFKADLIISDEDVHLINSYDEVANEEFLEALSRIEATNFKCRALLVNEHQKAGIEALDASNRYLDRAYQAMYRWVQKEILHLPVDNWQLSLQLKQVLTAFSKKPVLLKNCINLLTEARQTALSTSFKQALLYGETETSSRPIEMSAHDAPRYIGDMLAWIHSALIAETEAFDALLKSFLLSDQYIESLTPHEADRNGAAMVQILRNSLSPVCDILKTRARHSLGDASDAVTCLKVGNIFYFYEAIFSKDAKTAPVMESTTEELRNDAAEHLLGIWSAKVEARAETLRSVRNLDVEILWETIFVEVESLLHIVELSVTSIHQKQIDVEWILDHAFSPYIDQLNAAVRQSDARDKHIIVVNCLDSSVSFLRRFSPVTDRATIISERLQKYLSYIKQSELRKFITNSGMGKFENKLRKTYTHEDIEDFSLQLDRFLPTAVIDEQTSLAQIRSRNLRDELLRDLCRAFVERFERAENEIRIFSGGTSPIFSRTSEEVSILMKV